MRPRPGGAGLGPGRGRLPPYPGTVLSPGALLPGHAPAGGKGGRFQRLQRAHEPGRRAKPKFGRPVVPFLWVSQPPGESAAPGGPLQRMRQADRLGAAAGAERPGRRRLFGSDSAVPHPFKRRTVSGIRGCARAQRKHGRPGLAPAARRHPGHGLRHSAHADLPNRNGPLAAARAAQGLAVGPAQQFNPGRAGVGVSGMEPARPMGGCKDSRPGPAALCLRFPASVPGECGAASGGKEMELRLSRDERARRFVRLSDWRG